jgi:two-component system phosphate regulon response regulator PhoB
MPRSIVLERTIDVHIKALRRKLGEARGQIQTVRGLGYRSVPPGAQTGSHGRATASSPGWH